MNSSDGRALVPTLRACAEATERDRQISKQIVQLLREAQFFKLIQPRCFGGFEYGFTELSSTEAVVAHKLVSERSGIGKIVLQPIGL